jgi:hypothetical protein
LLTGHGGESGHHRRTRPLLQEVGLAPLTDVLGGLEEPEGPVALGVHDMLGNPFPIEVRHFLEQIVILEEKWPLKSSGE